MHDGQAHRRFAKIAEKWRDLAEKRRLHYVELHRSGRWELFHTEAEFARRLHEATLAVETWEALMPPAPPDAADVQTLAAPVAPKPAAIDPIAAALAALERRRNAA